MNCNICQKEYPERINLARHIVGAHKITTREYSHMFNVTDWYSYCTVCHKEILNSKHQLCIECFLVSDIKIQSGIQARKTKPIQGGENNPNYRGKKEFICPCGEHFTRRVSPSQEGKRFHIYCSTKCKKKYSISVSKFYSYKGNKLRSSWELSLAEYFDSKGYTWDYEPESFETSYGFYTPDFWVNELNCYFEVKGYFRDKEAKGKFEEFSKTHKIVLVNQDHFLSLGFTKIKSGPKKGQLCLPAVQH